MCLSPYDEKKFTDVSEERTAYFSRKKNYEHFSTKDTHKREDGKIVYF
jgi:hypothetical protein